MSGDPEAEVDHGVAPSMTVDASAAAEARDRAADEIRLMLTLDFRPGTVDEVAATLRPNVVLTRGEAGCLDFQVYRVDGADSRLVILEHWRSRADLDAHWEMPYMAEVFALFERTLVRPLSDAEDVARLSDVMGGRV